LNVTSFSGDAVKDGFNTQQSVVIAPPPDSGLVIPSAEVSIVPAASHLSRAKSFVGVMWQFEIARAESDSPVANASNWNAQTVGVGSTLSIPLAVLDAPVPAESLIFVSSEQPALTAMYVTRTPAWVWFPQDVFNYTITAATVSQDASMVCVTWPLRGNDAAVAGARSFVSCHESKSGKLIFRSTSLDSSELVTAPSIDLENNVYVGKTSGGVESFSKTGESRFAVPSIATGRVVSPVLLYPGKSLGFIFTADCMLRSFNLSSGGLAAPLADLSRWCGSTSFPTTLTPANRASSYLSLRTPGAFTTEDGPLLVTTPDWLIALPLSPVVQPSPGATEWPVAWYVRTSYCQIPSAPFIVDQFNVYYTACEKAGAVLSFYFEVFALPTGSNWPVLPSRHPISPALQYGLGIGIPITAIVLLVASFLYCTRSQPTAQLDRRPLMSSRV
jgi:hypothetical protein